MNKNLLLDDPTLSLKEKLNLISRHQLYEVKLMYQLLYQDYQTKEWIPYALFSNKLMAEHFEKLINHEFKTTVIIPVDYYQLSVRL